MKKKYFRVSWDTTGGGHEYIEAKNESQAQKRIENQIPNAFITGVKEVTKKDYEKNEW